MDIQVYDFVLDCCAGLNKIWYDNLNCNKDWCEIMEGKDFMEYNKQTDFIIGNYLLIFLNHFLIK